MENNLINYLDKRLGREGYEKNPLNPPGPVITISREVGCNGIKLARELATGLNAHGSMHPWKVISKEVLYESAKELHLDPDKINKLLKQTDRYTLDGILDAFSYKQFVSDRKVINTVVDVIHSYAIDGFCIIVGRAGHVIAKDIKNSLHLKVIAPPEYRVKNIMENNFLDRAQAIEFINRVESERASLRKLVTKEETKEEIYNFDLVINRATMSTEGIVSIIVEAVKQKNILADYKRKVEVV